MGYGGAVHRPFPSATVFRDGHAQSAIFDRGEQGLAQPTIRFVVSSGSSLGVTITVGLGEDPTVAGQIIA